MRIGLTSFVYCNYPLAEAIRRTAAAGYDGIDIWGGRPHAYRRDLSTQDVLALKRVLAENGLEVPSFIPAQFRYPTSLCSPSDVIRRDSVAYIEDAVVTASLLGAPVVSICPGHSLFGQSREDAWGRLSESVSTICAFAARHGVRIAIEPADRYETDLMATTADALRMVRELGLENLGVVLDNGHAHVVGEDAAAAIGALGDRLFHVHVDDNNAQRDQHLVPGEGSFPFQPFVAALQQAGYDGFLSAELSWDYTVDPDPAVQRTALALKQMQG